MKLISVAFLAALLSVQGFPTGEIGVSKGISVDVFINTMLTSFSAVKGKDNCDGVVSVFQSVLEGWKGKETFLTDSFLAAFKTALAVKKATHTLIFHHAIDAFKTVFEVGKVKGILISEGFLLAFKGALEAKKAIISDVFLKAFENGFWPGGKFLGNHTDDLKSNISVEVFVKSMVSAFGAKDGVVTENCIQKITEIFGKCKGVHSNFIPAWKRAFDTCKGTQETVTVAAFTLALKKESGLSFIPQECIDAIKSPDNANVFPRGIHEKIMSALFGINDTKSDGLQTNPINTEVSKSSITVEVFVKSMVSAFGSKNDVVTENCIQKITETFEKCKGSKHSNFIPAWKRAFDACKNTQETVTVAAFTLALKKESGLSFIPQECIEAIKSPDNANVFPKGIHEKILSALFGTNDTKSDGLQTNPINTEVSKSSITVEVFVKTLVSAFGVKDDVVTENCIQKITETFEKCKDSKHSNFIPAWKRAFDACKNTQETVTVAAFTLALKKESGLSFIPQECIDAIKSPDNAYVFPKGIHEKIMSALFGINDTKSDGLQTNPINTEVSKSSITVEVFVKSMVSAFGSKNDVVTENCIQKITETFEKCKGSKHSNFIPAWKRAFDACKNTQETVTVAAFTLALKKESGLSFIPQECIEAIKSPDNANVFPKGIHEKILSALFGTNDTKSDGLQTNPINTEVSKSSITVEVFVKTLVSAFGVKDDVVTENCIQKITEIFGKCKGVHSNFIPAWKRAFDACKNRQETVTVAAFTLALKKESGLSFIPQECIKAIRSPNNANAFPKGIHEKILSALFGTNDSKSDGTGDNSTGSEQLPSLLDPTPASSTPDKSGSTTETDPDVPLSESATSNRVDSNNDIPTPANCDSTTSLDSDSTQ